MSSELDKVRRAIAMDNIIEKRHIAASNDELLEIIAKIDMAQEFLVQGLLRQKEYDEVYQTAFDAYENTADHNSIQYRKYDKSRREHAIWREIPKSGYVSEGDGWSFADIRQQLVELLELKNVDTPSPKEVFLKPGSEFDATLHLRNILSSATTSIDIKDDYLFTVNKKTKNIRLLEIVSPYLGTSVALTVRLLGAEKELPSTISDINEFLKQYGNKVSIKGVVFSDKNKRETHDRFIIIDGSQVYNVGGSLKDLGSAQTSITQMTDGIVIKQYIEQFEKWWNSATLYQS